MKIFVSGATGFIGSKLVNELAGQGNIIHALFRSETKAKELQHKNIKLFKGDILDKESISKAVEGCEQAYHVAAFASIWVKDYSRIYHLNIRGAVNVIEESIKAGIKKMVLTSTAGVLGPSGDGMIDEKAVPSTFFSDYESSKAILEEMAKGFCVSGFPIVIVNPTRVFGPGLLSESNSVTIMIEKYINRKWHFIPGKGHSAGNYVYIDDVVKGHILAMEKGIAGERYILGGENLSYNQFFTILSEQSGVKTWMLRLPVFLMLGAASLMMFFANNFGIQPMITPAHVRKFNMSFNIDNSKSIKQLGYKPLSFKEALILTLSWINSNPNGKK